MRRIEGNEYKKAKLFRGWPSCIRRSRINDLNIAPHKLYRGSRYVSRTKPHGHLQAPTSNAYITKFRIIAQRL